MDEDKERERVLMQELVTLIEQRNAIVKCLDEDKQRYTPLCMKWLKESYSWRNMEAVIACLKILLTWLSQASVHENTNREQV